MKQSTQQALDVLSKGINAELASYVFYLKGAEKVSSTEISELLKKLAGEEKDHYWTLETQYDSLVRSEKWVTYNDILRKNGFPEVPEEMAETHKKKLAALDETNDERTILNMALELEIEARDLYKSQLDRVDDEDAKKMYDYLTKIEQGHVNTINSWLKKLK